MTGNEFREVCERIIHKQKMRKKTIVLIVCTWLAMIAGIEIIYWWPPNWISIPVMATCGVIFVSLLLNLIFHLSDLADERVEEKKRKKKEAQGY